MHKVSWADPWPEHMRDGEPDRGLPVRGSPVRGSSARVHGAMMSIAACSPRPYRGKPGAKDHRVRRSAPGTEGAEGAAGAAGAEGAEGVWRGCRAKLASPVT